MKGMALAALVVLNLVALALSATRFVVTFADVPVGGISAACSHAYHQGMTDMQNYLLPTLLWLAGAMVVNIGVVLGLWVRLRKRR